MAREFSQGKNSLSIYPPFTLHGRVFEQQYLFQLWSLEDEKISKHIKFSFKKHSSCLLLRPLWPILKKKKGFFFGKIVKKVRNKQIRNPLLAGNVRNYKNKF
jgi:hypothetical protein